MSFVREFSPTIRPSYTVDEHVAVVHGRVLRQDRDAALPLEPVGVHDPLDYARVGAIDPALLPQRVDQCCLAMVDVRDNGDVAPERVGDLASGFLQQETSSQYRPSSLAASGAVFLNVKR